MGLGKLINSDWPFQLSFFTVLILLIFIVDQLYSFRKDMKRYHNPYDTDILRLKRAETLSNLYILVIIGWVLITTFYEINKIGDVSTPNQSINTVITSANLKDGQTNSGKHNQPQNDSQDDRGKIWNPIPISIIFLTILFFKLLLCFLCTIIVFSIIRSKKLSEIGTKFLGFEFQEKFHPSSEEVINQIATQFDFAATISKYSIEWIESYQDQDIINSQNQVEYVRSQFLKVINAAYYDSNVNVYAIPCTAEGFNQLNARLRDLVRTVYEKLGNVVVVPHKYVGLGIVDSGGGEANTIIIIDTAEAGYEITSAEIQAAVMLFFAITEVVLLNIAVHLE